MATYYLYKRPITNSGAYTTTSMTVDAWMADNSKKYMPCLAIKDQDGDYYDIIEFVSEISIKHEDIDGDNAGRSKNSGAKMTREYLANKHTLSVKMVNHLPASFALRVKQLIVTHGYRTSFYARYQSPCADGMAELEFYVSSINYGAQRYDRRTNKCFYDGMSFNMIEM